MRRHALGAVLEPDLAQAGRETRGHDSDRIRDGVQPGPVSVQSGTMPMRTRSRTLLSLFALMGAAASDDGALSLEHQVHESDFVGIVECVVAGTSVARYQVIESWKGPGAGTSISIRVRGETRSPMGEPTFVGERYVLFAVRERPREHLSSIRGVLNPVRYRLLAEELGQPPLYRRERLPGREGRAFRGRRGPTNLPGLKADVLELLKAPPAEREAQGPPPPPRSPVDDPPPRPERLAKMRRWLLTGDSTSYVLNENCRRELVGLPDLETHSLSTMGGGEAADLFDALAVQDPAPVADWLSRWEPSPESAKDSTWGYAADEWGYRLASWFCIRCGKDRAACFRKLLSAKDPYIRVAGAVYLCFEDEPAGRHALRELLRLDGDPGGWAALTLARRGEKDAMPRLLHALRSPFTRKQRILRMNLFQETQVLLSNTAKTSSLPPPPTLRIPDAGGVAHLREACEAWWREHGVKAKLADPWLPLCAERKID